MVSREERLAQYFQIVGKNFKKELSQVDIGNECSIKDCRVFEILIEGQSTMSELSSILGVTPGTMTTQIDQLVDKKFVKREYDKDDRRKVYIVLTKKGEKIAKTLHDKHIKISKMMLSPLSDKEKDQFLYLLEKSTELFEE